MTSPMQAPSLVGHIRICDTDEVTDEQLAHALRAFKRAEKALADRRHELSDAIGSAVTERGVRQADAARQTGYTREHIRRICNDYIARKTGGSTMIEKAQ